ncbi:conserved hypothetical protein [Paraburkholderia piptadeniae]|uniref:Uncharacterized protein n=1 Tax=Paraburkholderia piptadeniae TaxID=1701573 RepID=A0A1N7RPK2_9BURK|nr:conserved hypothetical protein [Paraburkholderia piptadeniae]
MVVYRIPLDPRCAADARPLAACPKKQRTNSIRASGKTMRTQGKHSFAALNTAGKSPIEDTGRFAAMQSSMLQTDRIAPLNHSTEHNGYLLRARAKPTHCDLYAADLVIERLGHPSRHFHALDHFYDAGQALRYAIRWGRIWVDHQANKILSNANRSDLLRRQS